MNQRKQFLTLLPIYVLVLCFFVLGGWWGSRAVQTIHENGPIARNHTIIIDAGHGGVDGGATSCTGILESHINLQIAERLNDLLHLLGMNTMMLRSTDESLHTEGGSIAAKKISDLRERVRMINATPDAIFISIHQNYYSDSRYHGAQVFCNQNPDSKALAEKMQKKLVDTLDRTNHRQWKYSKDVYLLKHAGTPGILVECGFISNPQEERKLIDATYQKQLCCVIASVCCEYIEQMCGKA